AGALIVVGGAAAIAAVGQRDAQVRQGDRMYDMGSPGSDNDRDGRGRFRRDDDRGGGRRGWFGRSLSASDFDDRPRGRFARLDSNSDGVSDASEVEAAINARMEERGGGGERLGRRFLGRADANGDGKVTRQEALDQAKRNFERLDLDGDGRITD